MGKVALIPNTRYFLSTGRTLRPLQRSRLLVYALLEKK